MPEVYLGQDWNEINKFRTSPSYQIKDKRNYSAKELDTD